MYLFRYLLITSTVVPMPSECLPMLLDCSLTGCSCTEISKLTNLKKTDKVGGDNIDKYV